MKATKLSAVAMKEGSSDVIEVRLAGAAGDRLEVLQNQRSLFFSEQSWMDLQGELLHPDGPEVLQGRAQGCRSVSDAVPKHSIYQLIVLRSEYVSYRV